MKNYKPFFALLLLVFAVRTQAQNIVQFKLSEPYCLLNFLETCTDGQGTSKTLKDFAVHKGCFADSSFIKLLADYKSIHLDYSYAREQYPERRMRGRYGYTRDLLIIAAVQSDNLQQFRERAIGILPNSDHHKLFEVLAKLEPRYDSLVWEPYAQRIKTQFAALQQYQSRINTLFSTLSHFYQSSWTADVPFIVTIYPIPGHSGVTTATPHINSLCVGMLTDSKAYDNVAGVVLHEMCHSLYNEQPAAIQQAQENYFLNDPSLYGSFAYSYFDEGMATACGNGWARELFSNKVDTGQWYNDPYINGFGHALYPMVKDYLTQGKVMDSAFIAAAIKRFAETFPQAPYEYAMLFNNLNLYSDAGSAEEDRTIINTLAKYFHTGSTNSSSPILNETSLDHLRTMPGAQLIIVDKNITDNMTSLEKEFPAITAILKDKPDEDYILSFYDTARRPIIIIKTTAAGGMEKAFKQLQQQRHFSEQNQYSVIKGS